jgi:hypothetical protein
MTFLLIAGLILGLVLLAAVAYVVYFVYVVMPTRD